MRTSYLGNDDGGAYALTLGLLFVISFVLIGASVYLEKSLDAARKEQQAVFAQLESANTSIVTHYESD
ncbi:hypothetical protein [Treponema brennaborense]|uniref:Uncharacterized protein n=1 Tax=Treponema brennaborense (strain DSM 12168 / CIP 105900 / DD5/3) TaxID=906968 RepID=F4LMJ9_TREBD|nr:hypothetical protein [Treponema brennaborense]AEE16746.1 hypothetical protein Trebr_1319 [Treponema brennaborense DSM 12168]